MTIEHFGESVYHLPLQKTTPTPDIIIKIIWYCNTTLLMLSFQQLADRLEKLTTVSAADTIVRKLRARWMARLDV
jgi:hypothetical protein